MLTEKDRQALLRQIGPKGARIQAAYFCWWILMLFAGGTKVYLANLYAHLGGYSFSDFFALVSNDFDLQQKYSGFLIHANDCLNSAVCYGLLALMGMALWWIGRREREQAQRIVNALQRSGGW